MLKKTEPGVEKGDPDGMRLKNEKSAEELRRYGIALKLVENRSNTKRIENCFTYGMDTKLLRYPQNDIINLKFAVNPHICK